MTVHTPALDGKPLPPPRRLNKWWHFVERRLPIIVIYLMVISLIGAILAPHMFVTVPSGHVGLMWKRFRGGTLLDPRQLKDEGLRVLLPWDKMFLYDLRLQTTTDTYNAITKDGVSIHATVSVRFRLKHDSVPQLHQAIGPDYVARLVRPEIGSRMREVIAEYTAEEVYSTKRQEIQQRIRGHTQSMMSRQTMERTAEQSEYGDAYRIPMDEILNLLDTLVLGITLPPTVVNAINRKVEQYYLSEEYVFRVARERKESERKVIEANGIAEFQRIVSQGISDSYLRWRGIEATLQLAQSNNTKIVVIGNSKDGMPIILGNVDTPSRPPVQPADATPAPGAMPPHPAPIISLERTPANQLSHPVETFSSAGPERPIDGRANAGPPGAPPAGPRDGAGPGPQGASPAATGNNIIPRSLSDLEALLKRLIGSESASTERKPPEAAAYDAYPPGPTTRERTPPEAQGAHPPGPPPRDRTPPEAAFHEPQPPASATTERKPPNAPSPMQPPPRSRATH
jgi:regulator of protease activity HflC (stomatin/prohibitin superfamily)